MKGWRWGKFRVCFTCEGFKSETVVEAQSPEAAARQVVRDFARCNVKAVTSVMDLRHGNVWRVNC